MRNIKVGETYKHFKGNLYKVIGVARNSEDPNSEYVIYKALYHSDEWPDGQLWTRPLKMFLEKITREGKTFYRFEEVIQ